MRRCLWSAVLLAAACASGCATRAHPYRFAQPMLGMADVPPSWLGPGPGPGRPDLGNRNSDPLPSEDRTSTDGSRAVVRIASATAAEAVPADARTRGVVWSRLRAPHAIDPIAATRSPTDAMPKLHEPADLRAIVGQRDRRDAFAVTFAWSHALGATLDPALATGSDLVTWATTSGRLASPTDPIHAGDLLVFDHTDGDAPADLVALAIGRDDRGVLEMIYLAGGAVRRGFVDPRRPAKHRDDTGAIVNTYLRAGKRWPPKGTHYLAGELLAHVVRAR
jgi:hypothetical protein